MSELERRLADLEARYNMDKRVWDYQARVENMHHIWQYSEEQNVDAAQSMSFDVYIPANTTKQIQRVYLRIKLLALRAYDHATTAIVTGTSPSGCVLLINTADRTNALTGGATFAANQDALDITQYLTSTGYNIIEVQSAALGRIRATVFVNLYTSDN